MLPSISKASPKFACDFLFVGHVDHLLVLRFKEDDTFEKVVSNRKGGQLV